MIGRAGSFIPLAVVLVSLAQPACAETQQVRLSPADIAALATGGAGPGTSGVEGIHTTVLYGNPTGAGPYTIEIRVPPHTKIAAHTHRDDRTAVVVSGMWFFGYGDTADEELVKPLAPGSFYTEPADAPHFAMTRDEPAVVYITGQGPTDTHFSTSR